MLKKHSYKTENCITLFVGDRDLGRKRGVVGNLYQQIFAIIQNLFYIENTMWLIVQKYFNICNKF